MLSILMGFLVFIGLWATLGHYFAPRPDATMLETGFNPPGPVWFLEQLPRYGDHELITALHIWPSMLFMLMVLFQLSSRTRSRFPGLHRQMGRVIAGIVVIFSISGLLLGIVMPFGGGVESIATIIIAGLCLLFIILGILAIKKGKVIEHRYWMLHMVAIAFTPVTMRILLLFAMLITPYTGSDLFGPLMLLSLIINLVFLNKIILKYKERQMVRLFTNASTKHH